RIGWRPDGHPSRRARVTQDVRTSVSHGTVVFDHAARRLHVNERGGGGEMNPRAVIIIRILVGWVFLLEGVLKFVSPAENGTGRFAAIGIPHPGVMGPFVGVVEIVCGVMIIVGLLTRWAAFALLVDICVAIASTKVP